MIPTFKKISCRRRYYIITCKVAGITDTTTQQLQQLEGNEMKKEGSLDANEIGYLINVIWGSYCMTITSRKYSKRYIVRKWGFILTG
jgi:hypothetical protein